jgi:hypothetical protein
MNDQAYTYRAIWSPEDGEYVGLCDQFPSLSWLAHTESEALAGHRYQKPRWDASLIRWSRVRAPARPLG